MPATALHRTLIESGGIANYTAIPTLARWKGDIVNAMNRLQQLRKQALAAHFEAQSQGFDAQRQAIASQFAPLNGGKPAAAANSAQVKRVAFVAAVQQQQRQQQQQPPPPQPQGRIAGSLTNPDLLDAAINRYQAGREQVGDPTDQASKAILGTLLVDIYFVTGQFMRRISHDAKLRTDNDCALFPLYRSLHWAAADAFGKVFGISGDEIDVYLRTQLIDMTWHGVQVDESVLLMKPKNGKRGTRLAFLTDEGVLACRLHVDRGLIMITNGQGELEPFDCSGPEFQDISRDRKGLPTNTANTARVGREKNGGLGVAGFVMGLDRSIYARKHSNYSAPMGSFYHSGYFGGHEVLCAGGLTVVNGELRYINNWSGHYQPGPQQLALAVQALRAQGIEIANVTVQTLKTVALAPAFLQTEEGKGLDGVTKTRYVDAARRVREALAAYDRRRRKWWANPKEKSLRALGVLSKIEDDETLVREVRFRLKNCFSVILTGGEKKSPLGTAETEVFETTMKELPKSLIKALFPDHEGATGFANVVADDQ
jgi:hypothetical protein